MAKYNARKQYTVKRGDTLSSIAGQFGLDPQAITQSNPGMRTLLPGSVLQVASPTPTPPPPSMPPQFQYKEIQQPKPPSFLQNAWQNIYNYWRPQNQSSYVNPSSPFTTPYGSSWYQPYDMQFTQDPTSWNRSYQYSNRPVMTNSMYLPMAFSNTQPQQIPISGMQARNVSIAPTYNPYTGQMMWQGNQPIPGQVQQTPYTAVGYDASQRGRGRFEGIPYEISAIQYAALPDTMKLNYRFNAPTGTFVKTQEAAAVQLAQANQNTGAYKDWTGTGDKGQEYIVAPGGWQKNTYEGWVGGLPWWAQSDKVRKQMRVIRNEGPQFVGGVRSRQWLQRTGGGLNQENAGNGGGGQGDTGFGINYNPQNYPSQRGVGMTGRTFAPIYSSLINWRV